MLLVVITVQADNTPVLIWSPSRSMSDMPQSYIGHKLDAENFHDNYLLPLSSDEKNNLVIFVQNKLSIEDFTNHADVYNPSSDGGVFKNVKSAMEDDFSVQLPSVVSPMSSIDKLQNSFDGRVLKADNPESIADMKLTDGVSHLILVTLKPVDGVDEAKAFEENDQMIGKCIHHLNKRGVKFTAMYTAHTAAKREVAAEEVKGRHLLATDGDDDKDDRSFFKDKLVMMSLRNVNLSVSYPADEEDKKRKELTGNATYFPATSMNLTSSIVTENATQNGTHLIVMQLTNLEGKLTMSYRLSVNTHDEWRSINGTITYKGTNSSDFDFEDIPMDYKILAPKRFCFHCTQLSPDVYYRGFNNTKELRIGAFLSGFQLQAYTNTTEIFTYNVWDCVEFFTIGIWMGIISTVILIMILFFALSMVANISTMDRFDDPKGKPLTITVNE